MWGIQFQILGGLNLDSGRDLDELSWGWEGGSSESGVPVDGTGDCRDWEASAGLSHALMPCLV